MDWRLYCWSLAIKAVSGIRETISVYQHSCQCFSWGSFFLIGLVSWTAIFWGQKVYAFFAVRAISCLNSEWCSFIIYHWKATAIWSFTAEGQSNASNLNQGKSHDFWRGRRICLQRRFSHARGNRFSRPRKRRCFRHCCNQSAAAFGKWGQQTVLIGASYTS